MDQFLSLGAKIRIVERFHPAHPQSNKLRFLELSELEYYECVILLDCDTLVVQDPAEFVDGDSVQARIAGYPTIPHEIFVELFNFYNMEIPEKKYRCAVSGDQTILYCNAGVIIIPIRFFVDFVPVWIKLTRELCDNINILGEYKNYCEQASFTLALLKDKAVFRELPVEMNCPIPEKNDNISDKIFSCDPIIIHYHHKVDDFGRIKTNSNVFAKKRIDEFNRAIINFDF